MKSIVLLILLVCSGRNMLVLSRSTTDVPSETDLIVEFYFEPKSACTGVVIESDDGPTERSLSTKPGTESQAHSAREIDVHVRLGPGPHRFHCTSGSVSGTITAR